MNISQDPWSVIGDFNSVFGSHEKLSKWPPHRLACSDFQKITDDYDLIHLDHIGAPFTWSNHRYFQGGLSFGSLTFSE